MKCTTWIRRPWLAGLLVAATWGTAGLAQAEVILTMTRENLYTGITKTNAAVPLSGTGALSSAAFDVPAGSRVIVSYSAQCSVRGSGYNDRLNIDVRIVNTATGQVRLLPPTNTDADAFCSSNDTVTFDDGWQMNAVHAVALGLPQGSYRVEVFANVTSGAGSLGYSSLVVWR